MAISVIDSFFLTINVKKVRDENKNLVCFLEGILNILLYVLNIGCAEMLFLNILRTNIVGKSRSALFYCQI